MKQKIGFYAEEISEKGNCHDKIGPFDNIDDAEMEAFRMWQFLSEREQGFHKIYVSKCLITYDDNDELYDEDCISSNLEYGNE